MIEVKENISRRAHVGSLDEYQELYRESLEVSGGFSGSPVAAGGKIYYTAEKGDVVVLKAGREFSVLGTNSLGEACMSTPAISEGVLFFRSKDHVIAIGTSGK